MDYHFILQKLMWLLESLFYQNSIVVYDEFNGNFKIKIHQLWEDKMMVSNITYIYEFIYTIDA